MNLTAPESLVVSYSQNEADTSYLQIMAIFISQCFIILIFLLLLTCCCCRMSKSKQNNTNRLTKKRFEITKYNDISIVDKQILSKMCFPDKSKIRRNDNDNSDDATIIPINEQKKIVLYYHFDNLNNQIKGTLASKGNTDDIFKNLEAFVNIVLSQFKSSDVKIVLHISSPGGYAYKFENAYSNLIRLKDNGFETIAVVDSICASGGYMLACACGKIMSSKLAQVGSIGVIAHAANYHELSKKIGFTHTTFATGKYKQIFPTCEPIDQSHIEVMNELMNDSFDVFKRIVQNARNLTEEQMKIAFSAKMMYGDKALNNGLVDTLKNLHDYLGELAETCDVYIVGHVTEEKTGLAGLLSLESIPKILSCVMNDLFKNVTHTSKKIDILI